MDEFKSIAELFEMDEKHCFMGAVTGGVPDLEKMHKSLSAESLNNEVPYPIQEQFVVAKNMALYSYFYYALAPEVHLKTYVIIEHALRLKVDPKKRTSFKKLMHIAVAQKWITDEGFRHLDTPCPKNSWCKSMIDVMPSLRNSQAHGSNFLVGDCFHHIASCADFLNQLYPFQNTPNNSSKRYTVTGA